MIRTLTNRSFQKNKGRNFVAIIAVFLTTMMFTTLFTLAQSMGKNMTELYLRQSGTTAHASAKEITDAQIEQIAAHPDIVSYGRSIVAGVAENRELAGRQLEIRYGSDQYVKDSFAYPTSGKMPERKDEIALDAWVLEQLGIPLELGQTVTLEWQQGPSIFTLCGWWEGNRSSYASMAWVSEEFVLDACNHVSAPKEGQVLGLRMMGITFEDDKNIAEKVQKVLSDCSLTDMEFKPNIAYTAEMQSSILAENLPMYGGMLFVFIAGYFIIYNIFQISVAADISFYGMLKTLGMTAKQMKKMIYGQGNRLALMGIPIGLVVGYLLGSVLVPVLIPVSDFKLTISASPIIFIGASLFSYVTVIISCMLPARIAGRVSPIEALRYTDADSGVRKKCRKSKNGASLPKMAWENLWRNRKRTVMVLCSLTLGFVLMSFFYAKNASFDIEKYLMDLSVADYEINDAFESGQVITDALLEELAALGTVESTGRLYFTNTKLTLSAQARENLRAFYTDERLKEFASYDPTFPLWKDQFDLITNGGESTYTIYGADGLILEAAINKNYLLNGVFDTENFAGGNYCLAIGPSTSPGSLLLTYSVGEKVQIAGREFEVMAVVSPLQPMVAGVSEQICDLPLIIPADCFKELFPECGLRKYYFNVADETLEDVNDLLTAYQNATVFGMNIVSRQTIAEQYETQTRAALIMGYTISAVIAIVGMLNFVNSMVTSIISRKREFAMIQSIGMTKRQLCRMLTFEGGYYAGLTLIASYVIGALTVGVLVRGMVEGGFSTFHFTLLPLICCTPVLLVLAVMIPYLCFRNLERQSIVERLRAE